VDFVSMSKRNMQSPKSLEKAIAPSKRLTRSNVSSGSSTSIFSKSGTPDSKKSNTTKRKTKVPDPVILSPDQPIDSIETYDGKPKAIIRSASKRPKSQGSQSIRTQELNIPTLWIKGNDGSIHLLNAPAPTTERYSTTMKQNDRKIDLTFVRKKASKMPKKPASLDVYSTTEFDDILLATNIQGVKITCEVENENPSMKEVELQTLIQQQAQLRNEVVTTPIVIKKYEDTKKDEKKKTETIKRRPIIKKKETVMVKNEFMYHIPHPNLMSPLFELPLLGRILFGPFEKEVEVVEQLVWQPVHFPSRDTLIYGQT
jgi:hypothetical protein